MFELTLLELTLFFASVVSRYLFFGAVFYFTFTSLTNTALHLSGKHSRVHRSVTLIASIQVISFLANMVLSIIFLFLKFLIFVF